MNAGGFYCHNHSDDTQQLLDVIFQTLNGRGVLLEPVKGKIGFDKMYATMFYDDKKFYRCKVERFSEDDEHKVWVSIVSKIANDSILKEIF